MALVRAMSNNNQDTKVRCNYAGHKVPGPIAQDGHMGLFYIMVLVFDSGIRNALVDPQGTAQLPPARAAGRMVQRIVLGMRSGAVR